MLKKLKCIFAIITSSILKMLLKIIHYTFNYTLFTINKYEFYIFFLSIIICLYFFVIKSNSKIAVTIFLSIILIFLILKILCFTTLLLYKKVLLYNKNIISKFKGTNTIFYYSEEKTCFFNHMNQQTKPEETEDNYEKIKLKAYQEGYNQAKNNDYLKSYFQNERQEDASYEDSNFFSGITNEDSLKKRYRDLMKIYHPDNANGDATLLEIIQKQYESEKIKLK